MLGFYEFFFGGVGYLFCFSQANYTVIACISTGYVDTLLSYCANIIFQTYQTMPVAG